MDLFEENAIVECDMCGTEYFVDIQDRCPTCAWRPSPRQADLKNDGR